jgi:hypothetical protein
MGDVRFVRQFENGRDLIFAFAADGTPAWAFDRVTGQQWWYPGGDQLVVREAITENWNGFSVLPVAPRPGGAARSTPALETPAGLRAHRPGHAVLAKIAELHASAFTATSVPVLPDEIISWSVGFVGEEATGAELGRLGPDWTVLHSVPIGDRGSDIDHVVIGPAGVYCINTKHHRGARVDVRRDAVFVAGQYQHYLDNSRHEADRTSAIVHEVVPGVPVRPLLVTVGAKLNVRESPSAAAVLRHDQLVGWLLGQPARLTPDVVQTLGAALSHSDRWSSLPPVPAAPEWVAELARSLATEKALVADQKRRGRSHTVALPTSTASRGSSRPATSRRPARARRRSRSARRMPFLARLAIAIGAGLAILLIVPPLVGLFFGAIARSITSSVESGSAAAIPVHTLGSPCTPRGSTAKDVAGLALVCAPVSSAKPLTLVWNRPA